MASLADIETALVSALKSRNQVAADTLRGLKTRIQNEKISKGKELEEAEIVALVQSEVKRRKEAADSFRSGGREESAIKEEAEMEVLSVFLPPQVSEDVITATVDAHMQADGWTAADFGKAMAALKAEFGASADGATIARILKAKLG